MRPYTGQQVIRHGWRMQDKRVRPGMSDYYVHDEDGRPVMRMASPSHDSLTVWLSPIARLLRHALGPEETILLAFDRAGAFPKQMAALREDGFEFVTYERRPYRTLPDAAFTEEVTLDGEKYRFCDTRKNLGKGRGRVMMMAHMDTVYPAGTAEKRPFRIEGNRAERLSESVLRPTAFVKRHRQIVR